MLARRMTLFDLLAETAKADKELLHSNDEWGADKEG
jgi:antitoxin component of MazEF toxin-antitoxin module